MLVNILMDGKPVTRRRILRAMGSAPAGHALLVGASRPALGQSSEAWPQFGYDAANSGSPPARTGPVTDFEVEWSFEAGDRILTSPAVVNGTVYFGVRGIHALDTRDGTEQATFEPPLDGWVGNPPAVVDGTIYVGASKACALTGKTTQEQSGLLDLVESRSLVLGLLGLGSATVASLWWLTRGDNGDRGSDGDI